MAEVLSHAALCYWKSGESIFQQGELAKHCFLVEHGRIRLYQLTSEGHEILIRFVTPGRLVGFSAAAELSRFPVNAIAVQPTDALVWTGNCIRDLMLRHPRLGMNALAAAVNNMIRYESRCPVLASHPLEQRIENALEELARCIGRREGETCVIDGGVFVKDVAELAGASVYSVSRILTKWRRDGYIEGGRGRIMIRYSGDRLNLPLLHP